jgi:hypothetical protein
VAGHRGPLEGIVLAAGEHVPEEHSLRAVAVAAICWPRRALMGSKNGASVPAAGHPRGHLAEDVPGLPGAGRRAR